MNLCKKFLEIRKLIRIFFLKLLSVNSSSNCVRKFFWKLLLNYFYEFLVTFFNEFPQSHLKEFNKRSMKKIMFQGIFLKFFKKSSQESREFFGRPSESCAKIPFKTCPWISSRIPSVILVLFLLVTNSQGQFENEPLWKLLRIQKSLQDFYFQNLLRKILQKFFSGISLEITFEFSSRVSCDIFWAFQEFIEEFLQILFREILQISLGSRNFQKYIQELFFFSGISSESCAEVPLKQCSFSDIQYNF